MLHQSRLDRYDWKKQQSFSSGINPHLHLKAEQTVKSKSVQQMYRETLIEQVRKPHLQLTNNTYVQMSEILFKCDLCKRRVKEKHILGMYWIKIALYSIFVHDKCSTRGRDQSTTHPEPQAIPT